MTRVKLSQEQELFIEKALEGKNILVNACIGSGKTTAIQHLCDMLPSTKRVLYLTYNKLLKLDARKKIENPNVTVTNYHGFAFFCLNRQKVRCGISDLIQTFNKVKPIFPKYDVLVIDEYQDIEQELAEMVEIVKQSNPAIQIIAVGDMEQKIYDKTSLDVNRFIHDFLGEHLELEFTICFRLNPEYAKRLGRIWGKDIKGANENCVVEEMSSWEVVNFLKAQNPGDVLCLGARTGKMSDTLNLLEDEMSSKYNKYTVFASIDEGDRVTEPDEDCAIFTTFDSSKGLEKKIVVIFDYTEDYWRVRMSKPLQKYEILRNIFLVAASRGKDRVIFVNDSTKRELLSDETISTPKEESLAFEPVWISEMFDFKFKEDVERCFSLLKTSKVPVDDDTALHVKTRDGLIDLSPCIGTYQEASYFNGYDIDKEIEAYLVTNKEKSFMWSESIKNTGTMEEKVLMKTRMETNQDRYVHQVALPFINKEEKEAIHQRLGGTLSKDEDVQVRSSLLWANEDGVVLFEALGMADVVKDDTVYELKFVNELKHEHFLQCACYMAALNLEKGILWNVRDNTKYRISIPDKQEFLGEVLVAATKGVIRPQKPKKSKNKKKTQGKSKKKKSSKTSKKTKESAKTPTKVEEIASLLKLLDKPLELVIEEAELGVISDYNRAILDAIESLN